MRKLIPDFILNRHQMGQLTGSLQAYILYVDLKGITALTQALMSHSHAGVEVLTDTINKLFSPTIAAIESLGGFVSGFAGDAFTAIFPIPPNGDASYILAAALKIRNSVVAKGRQVTEFGEFGLEGGSGLHPGKCIGRSWKRETMPFTGFAALESKERFEPKSLSKPTKSSPRRHCATRLPPGSALNPLRTPIAVWRSWIVSQSLFPASRIPCHRILLSQRISCSKAQKVNFVP